MFDPLTHQEHGVVIGFDAEDRLRPGYPSYGFDRRAQADIASLASGKAALVMLSVSSTRGSCELVLSTETSAALRGLLRSAEAAAMSTHTNRARKALEALASAKED